MDKLNRSITGQAQHKRAADPWAYFYAVVDALRAAGIDVELPHYGWSHQHDCAEATAQLPRDWELMWSADHPCTPGWQVRTRRENRLLSSDLYADPEQIVTAVTAALR